MDNAKRELKLLLKFFTDHYGTNTSATSSSDETVEFNPKDVNFIMKILNLLKSEFSHFSKDEEVFLMPLMTLSAHAIVTGIYSGYFPRSQLESMNESLLYSFQFLLKVLSNYCADEYSSEKVDPELFKQNAKAPSSSITSNDYYYDFVKYRLINFVIFLIDGQKPEEFFNVSELRTLVEMLNSKKMPNSLWYYPSDNEKKSGYDDSATNKNRSILTTCKISKDIYNNLRNPISLGNLFKDDHNVSFERFPNSLICSQNNSINLNQMFVNFSKSGNIFFNILNNHTLIQPFIEHIKNVINGRPLVIQPLPESVNSCVLETILFQIGRDINLMYCIFELSSILEPLSAERLSNLFIILQALFHASFTFIAWSSELNSESLMIEETLENNIEKSIKIYEMFFAHFKSVQQDNKQVCLLAHLRTSWIISSDIRYVMVMPNFADMNLIKQCHPFITFAFNFNGILFENFYLMLSDIANINDNCISKFLLERNHFVTPQTVIFMHENFMNYSIEAKFNLLYDTIIDWLNLLFVYCDECLQRADYFKKEFIKFELINKLPSSSNDKFLPDGKPSEESSLSLADSHYELVIKLLNYLDQNYFHPNYEVIQPFKNSLKAEQIIFISKVIKLLDESLSFVCEVPSSKNFNDFGLCFTRLICNMISLQILNNQQQTFLLQELGFLTKTESKDSINLYQGLYSLTIGGRIVFLQQEYAKENLLKIDMNCFTIKIWFGIIKNLQKRIELDSQTIPPLNMDYHYPDYNEDFNVEHAQLSLYLFHGMELIQRKEVFTCLILTIHSLGRNFNRNTTLLSSKGWLYLTRLLHIFEYMIHHFYEAPKFLLEQVRDNIMMKDEFYQLNYNGILLKSCITSEKKLSDIRTLKFFNNDSYEMDLLYSFFDRKSSTDRANERSKAYNALRDFVAHPRFYSLLEETIQSLKTSFERNCNPKLDGIACNILLSGVDDLTYSSFYESIFTIFDVIGFQYDIKPSLNNNEKASLGVFGMSSIDYVYQTMWRLIYQLPPVISLFKEFINDTRDFSKEPISSSLLISYCIWMGRFENSHFIHSVVEQNMKILQNNEDKAALQRLLESDIELFVTTSRKLQFNQILFKRISENFFHTNSNSIHSLDHSIDFIKKEYKAIQELSQLRFYNIFAIDLFLERFMSLIDKELYKNDKNGQNQKIRFKNDLIYEQIIFDFVCLFQKLYNDFNVFFCYVSSANEQERTAEDDFTYMINRAIIEIMLKNNESELTFSDGPILKAQKSVQKFISLHSSLEFASCHEFVKGAPHNMPLFEANPEVISHFYPQKFLDRSFSRELIPNFKLQNNICHLNSESFSWLKAKQFWMKLYSYANTIYFSQSDQLLHTTDLFVQNQCSIKNSYLASSINSQISNQMLQKVFNNSEHDYTLQAFPYFFRNASFILNIFNRPEISLISRKNLQILSENHSKISIFIFKAFIERLNDSGNGLVDLLCDNETSTPTGVDNSANSHTRSSFSLVDLIDVAILDDVNPGFSFGLLKVFKTLYSVTSKSSEHGIKKICSNVSSQFSSKVDLTLKLKKWFEKASLHIGIDCSADDVFFVLFKLIHYICQPNSQIELNVYNSFNDALLEFADGMLNNIHASNNRYGNNNVHLFFPIIFNGLVNLASISDNSSIDSSAHLKLITSVVRWLEPMKQFLYEKDVVQKIVNETDGKHRNVIESVHQMISYLVDIFSAFECEYFFKETFTEKLITDNTMIDDDLCCYRPESEGQTNGNDPQLNEDLCTFIQTKKEFSAQHWYHCNTCKLIESEGACSVCARICHDGHDVCYSKWGPFFCDCGEKAVSCLALERNKSVVPKDDARCSNDSSIIKNRSPFTRFSKYWFYSTYKHSSKYRFGDNFKILCKKFNNKSIMDAYKHFGLKFNDSNSIIQSFSEKFISLSGTILELVECFYPILESYFNNDSDIGFHLRIRKQFEKLHESLYSFDAREHEFFKLIGSTKDPVFDNMTSADENDLRSCSLNNSVAIMHGRNHLNSYLFGIHDRTRISIVDFNQIVNKVSEPTGKSKTVFRHQPTIQLPFSPINLDMNPLNERMLVISGPSNCRVLQLSDDSMVIENCNVEFDVVQHGSIIKTVWLPNSHHELAIISKSCIQIFDLSLKNRDTPYYLLLAPFPTIADVTFVTKLIDGTLRRFVLVLTIQGKIFCQELSFECSLDHGDVDANGFYLMEMFDVNLSEIKPKSESVESFSIYYSHTLGMLFFGISGRDIYVTSFTIDDCIQVKMSPLKVIYSGKSNGTWTQKRIHNFLEISTHPGLVFSRYDQEVIAFIFTPNNVEYQFINAERGIFSFIPVHYKTPTKSSTVLMSITLTGTVFVHESLSSTNYWLKSKNASLDSPIFSGFISSDVSKTFTHERLNEKEFVAPVNFFENYEVLDDVTFQGDDLLDIYSPTKIKSRLMDSDQYIACNKKNGFSIVIVKNVDAHCITGIRVQLGRKDNNQAPSSIQVFNRTIQASPPKPRWYDIAFSDSEIRYINTNKSFTVKFGQSSDPSYMTIVVSIKVYGTKDRLHNENKNRTSSSHVSSSSFPSHKLIPALYCPPITEQRISKEQNGISVVYRFLSNAFDSLESLLFFQKAIDIKTPDVESEDCEQLIGRRQRLIDVASKLLIVSLSNHLDRSLCLLLAKVLQSRTSYDEYRDEIILKSRLNDLDNCDEIIFSYNLATFRQIASERPKNFIRIVNRYLEGLTTVSDDPLEVGLAFNRKLNGIFWCFNFGNVSRSAENLTEQTHRYIDIKALLENLIFVHFSLLIASVNPNMETSVFETSSQHLRLIEATSKNILEFLSSSNLIINFAAKNALFCLIGNNFEEKAKVVKPNSQEDNRKIVDFSQSEPGTSASVSSLNPFRSSLRHVERDNSSFISHSRTVRRRNLSDAMNDRFIYRPNQRNESDNVYAELRSLTSNRRSQLQQNQQQSNTQGQNHRSIMARIVQRFASGNSRRSFPILPAEFEFDEDPLNEEADEDEEDEDDDDDDDEDDDEENADDGQHMEIAEDDDDEDDDEDLDDMEPEYGDIEVEQFVDRRLVNDRLNNSLRFNNWANQLGFMDIDALNYGDVEAQIALNFPRVIDAPSDNDIPVGSLGAQQFPAIEDSEEEVFNRNNSDDEEQFDENLLDASIESFQSPKSDGSNGTIRRTISESSQTEVKPTLSSLNVSGSSLSRKNSHCPQKLRKSVRKAVLSKFVLATLGEMANNLKSLEKRNDILMLPFFQTIDKFTDFTFKESDRKEFGRVYSNLCMKLLDFSIENSKNITSESNKNAILYFVLRLLCLLMGRFKHTPNLQLSSMNNDTLDLLKASMIVQNISFGTLLSNRKDSQDPANLSPGSYSLCLIVAHLLNSSESLFQMCYSSLSLLLKNYWKQIKSERKKFSKESSTVNGQMPGTTLRNSRFNFAIFAQRSLFYTDLKPFLESPSIKDSDALENLLNFNTEHVSEIFLQFCLTLKKLVQNAEQSGDLKLYSGPAWDSSLINLLCEYLATPSLSDHPIRKLIRRLLGLLCGSKEQYRKMRDYFDIRSRLNSFKRSLVEHLFTDKPISVIEDDEKINKYLEFLVSEVFILAHDKNKVVTTSGIHSVLSQVGIFNFSYSELVQFYDALIYGFENALERNVNWQELCESDSSILPILFKICLLFEGEIAEVLITLIDTAIFRKTITLSKDGKDVCLVVTRNLFSSIPNELMMLFIRSFLLESNSVSVRSWAHRLFKHAYEMLTLGQKEDILKILWELVPNLPTFGRRAVEFYDVLGHYTLYTQILSSSSDECEKHYCDILVSLLQHLNQILSKHPNWSLYNSLQNYIEFNGQHYLETEPCMICNSPEPPHQSYKLSQLKVDARFTVDSVMIKLNGTYSFSKISLKMTEVKKTKQLKTLKIFYNNRLVQNVASLKSPTTQWLLAKSISVNMNQSDVQINFGLPIVACNLMFKFASFFDVHNSTPESAQCPRCSSMVPANPGICNNCGENVFQCHKCRAINYDEKDPFLCHACGYCRYAKFEYNFTACHAPNAVQRILSDDDRQKAVHTLNVNMEKADKIYHQIVEVRSDLENLLIMSQGCQNTVYCDSSTSTKLGPLNQNMNSMNVNIKRIADRYSQDGKILFEDFSKIVQTVLVTRKELVCYDNSQDKSCSARAQVFHNIEARAEGHACSYPACEPRIERTSGLSAMTFDSTQCFACNSATVRHCIGVLTLLSSRSSKFKTKLSSTDLFRELLAYNLRFGSASLREEVRSLLCTLLLHNEKATEEFNRLILNRVKVAMVCKFINNADFEPIRHEVALFALTFKNADFYWESRVRCAMEIFLLSFKNKSPVVLESVTLPCLKILLSLIEKPALKDKDGKESVKFEPQVVDVPLSLEDHVAKFTVDLMAFLSNNVDHSFFNWQERNKFIDLSAISKLDSSSEEYKAHAKQLERKYFSKWCFMIKMKKQNCSFKQELSQLNWMRATLFDPTSKSLRKTVQKLFLILFERSGNLQKLQIDLLTWCFDGIGEHHGEVATEFFQLYHSIVFPELSFNSPDEQPQQSNQTGTITKNTPQLLSNDWRYYLVLKGIFKKFIHLISGEIQRLKKLEEQTLCSDISQGFTLKQLVELLQLFLLDERIRRIKNSSLIGFVLESYLSLRMLIVQRTKNIDEAEAALLQLMEILIGGNKENTIKFMYICIEYVEKCSLQDYRTPVFLFERISSIIFVQEKVADEYFITIEKDSMQEDFLQGRMQGNPYSSKDPALGPFMRDIKNKICIECEMPSFLEDDSALELLVNSKVISLDLSVKEVYKNIVLKEYRQRTANQQNNGSEQNRGEGSSLRDNDPTTWQLLRNLNMLALANMSAEAISNNITNALESASSSVQNARAIRVNTNGPVMKVVYRIRGLMGPATEEIIDSFKEKEDVVNDDEKTYAMAKFMSTNDCAGIKVLLKRLDSIKHLDNRVRQLLDVLLKLFSLTLKIQINREMLIDPKFNAVGILLKNSYLLLKEMKPDATANESSQFEQILDIIDIILIQASEKAPQFWDDFVKQSCGTVDDLCLLYSTVFCPKKFAISLLPPAFVTKVLRICAFLAIGNELKMKILFDHFQTLDFERIDDDKNLRVNMNNYFETKILLFSSVHDSSNGSRFKDLLLKEEIVQKMIAYLIKIAPSSMSSIIKQSDWKGFTCRFCPPYVLRMLTGLCRNHEKTQLLVAEKAIGVIHNVEKLVLEAGLATIAENLMEVLKQNPHVAEKIEQVRKMAKEERKRLAMSARTQGIGKMGFKITDSGQIYASEKLLKSVEGQIEVEKGLTCSMCLEGYQYKPNNVLGIYVYMKRIEVEPFERETRKRMGHSTVTHFNLMHFECHHSAIRNARIRDEWSCATMYNASTRCNALLPLWGPSVSKEVFVQCFIRYQNNINDSIGSRDFSGYVAFAHDLKILLLGFSKEVAFHKESGGGARSSNIHLVAHLAHTALFSVYQMNSEFRDINKIQTNFILQPVTEYIDSSFTPDSPYFWSIMTLLLEPRSFWIKNRLYFLKRLILCEVARNTPEEKCNPSGFNDILNDIDSLSFNTFKIPLMFFFLVDQFFSHVFKDVKESESHPYELMNYIRMKSMQIVDAGDELLKTFESDILVCESFEEYCDAAGLLETIPDPRAFLVQAFQLSQDEQNVQ